jgi:hypothetical protein
MPKESALTKFTRATGVIAGLKKRFSPGEKVMVRGKDWPVDDLVALFQAEIDALAAVRARYGEYLSAVAAERKLAPRCRTMEVDLKGIVGNLFGPEALAEFGWRRPKKTGPKTVAAKAASAEKARETRKVRGTGAKRKRRR